MSAGSIRRPPIPPSTDDGAPLCACVPGGPAVRAHRAVQRRSRGERRCAYRVPCRIRELGGAAPEALEGQTVNISGGGLALLVSRALDAGLRVEVLLPTPDGAGIRMAGEVAHSRRVVSGTFEVGVRLLRAGNAP
jgi:hypothetical protein